MPKIAGGSRTRRECTCPRSTHRHGTRAAYNRDLCRCAPCTRANAAAARAARRTRARHQWQRTSPWDDASATRRRLQALTAAGWSTRQLARAAYVTPTAIAQLRTNPRDRVLTATAADIARLYDQLWWQTPPGNTARSERHARRLGWASPWDAVPRDQGRDATTHSADGTAPERTAGTITDDPSNELDLEHLAARAGARMLTRALARRERRVVVARLGRRGRSAREIAAALGCSTRTVERDRAALRAHPAAGAAA